MKLKEFHLLTNVDSNVRHIMYIKWNATTLRKDIVDLEIMIYNAIWYQNRRLVPLPKTQLSLFQKRRHNSVDQNRK
jgi:hypothetical protein